MPCIRNPPAARFGAALTLVTWVVVEVERVSAVALNMLVSTSFPAELLLICRRESSGINRATTGEPPMLAPKELGPSHRDAPTQPSTGRESGKGKKDTALCFQLDGFGGGRERFPQLFHEMQQFHGCILLFSIHPKGHPKCRALRLPLSFARPCFVW